METAAIWNHGKDSKGRFMKTTGYDWLVNAGNFRSKTSLCGSSWQKSDPGMPSRKRNCFQRPLYGFTLVELLVVIFIIALLIALLLPALSSAHNDAEEMICASNLRELGQGVQIYVEEYQAYPPTDPGDWPFGHLSRNTGESAEIPTPWGFGLLFTDGIITNRTFFYCPQAGFFGPANPSNYLPTYAPVWQPNLAQTADNNITWWTNVYLGYCYWVGRAQGNSGATTGTVTNPWTQVTSNINYLDPSALFTQQGLHNPHGIMGSDLTASYGGNWFFSQWPEPISNHVDSGSAAGSNILYSDGSVEWKGPSQLHCNYTLSIFDFWE